MLAIPVAGLLGGPVSAALLSMDSFLGLAGWRWLFLLEALPAIVLSFVVWRWLPNRPAQARWLKPDEVEALEAALQQEQEQRHSSSIEAGHDEHSRAAAATPRPAGRSSSRP
jgi:MFS family permease